MQVTLSTGETVHIKDLTWTHRIQKQFVASLYRNPLPDNTPRAEAFYEAYEALFPLFIEKITSAGKEKPYGQDWLDGLPKDDYTLIQKALDDINRPDMEAGKKILERVKPILFSTLGTDVRAPDEFIEYRMCRAFHCLPKDLETMKYSTYLLFQQFMRLEAEAATIAAKRHA